VARTFKPDPRAAIVQLTLFCVLVAVFFKQILHGHRKVLVFMLVFSAWMLIRQLRLRVVVDDAYLRVGTRMYPWGRVVDAQTLPQRRLRGPIMLVVAKLFPSLFIPHIGVKILSDSDGTTKQVKLPGAVDQEELLAAILERIPPAISGDAA